jgi:hypothetical protein
MFRHTYGLVDIAHGKLNLKFIPNSRIPEDEREGEAEKRNHVQENDGIR